MKQNYYKLMEAEADGSPVVELKPIKRIDKDIHMVFTLIKTMIHI